MKKHTTLDLDRDLVAEAAHALGTTRTTDTVHAALREVVARQRRARLAQRDFSDLEALLPEMRVPRFADLDLRRLESPTATAPKSRRSTLQDR